ncbi:MAG: (2Fe-2S) ferredoxin domain-containing protein [Bacteroidales bacterium]|nr:(2Fe-2S) ferredoxin domain-containing protein [Bacteroidales bacterium]
MDKIKSFADLKKKREELQSNLKLRESGDNVENMIQVKVAMGTCGIAAGAKATMEAIINECQKQNLDVVVTQTGCMGKCNAEPMVEVKKPGQDSVVFENLKADKVADFVAKNLK